MAVGQDVDMLAEHREDSTDSGTADVLLDIANRLLTRIGLLEDICFEHKTRELNLLLDDLEATMGR